MAINVFEGARRTAKSIAVVWAVGWIVAAFYVSPSVNVTYKLVGAEEVLASRTDECPPDSVIQYHDIETKSGTKAAIKLCRVVLAKAAAMIEELEFLERARLEGALVKADAIGNTEDARAIAAEIRKMRGKTSPTGSGARDERVESAFEITSPDGRKFKVTGPEGTTKEQALNYAAGPWQKYSADIGGSFAIPKADEEWIDGQWWTQLLEELREGTFVAMGGLLFLWAFTWVIGWVVRGFIGIPQGADQKASDTSTSRHP